MSSDLEKLLVPIYDADGDPLDSDDAAEQLQAAKTQLQENYLAVRQAIIDLATGKAVSKVVISGKTSEFMQADLPQLRTLRDELANELRSLLDIAKGKCYKLKTKSGF